MPLDALALALGAACLHALWNVLLARTRDPQAATAAAFCMAVVIWAPVAAVRWRVEAGAWKWIAASAAFELAYVLLLSEAYARAPLSVFYPIARGLAPVLVLLVAVLALGATTSAAQAVGVCAVGGGILLVRGRRPDRSATLFGVAIAATIAGYTLIDNTGVTLADPLAYLEAVMVGPAIVTAAVVAVRQGRPALRAGFRRETHPDRAADARAVRAHAVRAAARAGGARRRRPGDERRDRRPPRRLDAEGARLALAARGRCRGRCGSCSARRLDN